MDSHVMKAEESSLILAEPQPYVSYAAATTEDFEYWADDPMAWADGKSYSCQQHWWPLARPLVSHGPLCLAVYHSPNWSPSLSLILYPKNFNEFLFSVGLLGPLVLIATRSSDGLTHFEYERGGCCSVDSQLMGEKQDLNMLLSALKAHVLSIYYSVLHTEGAQYMFAVCDEADGI